MVHTKDKHRIKVCPKCNNPHIRQSSSISGWLTPDDWVCDKCGYQGNLVKEILADEKG